MNYQIMTQNGFILSKPAFFTPSTEMVEAAKTVFMAMAWKGTIEPIVTGYEREILSRHQFHISDEWTAKGMPDKIILDPKETYLLNDIDSKIYINETFMARDNAGLKVDNPEFCPLLVAETMQIDAETALIATMESITHLEPGQLYGENRKKLIDLTLRLLAPFMKGERKVEP